MSGPGPIAALVALALSSCPAQRRSEAPPTDSPSTPAVQPVPEAQRGAPLEIHVPLYGEGTLPLSALRGKFVIVDLFVPDEPGWRQAHADWGTFALAHAADVAFVAVAVAATDPAAVDAWDADPPVHLVAWDPQGALALRLGARALPTVVVLDRQGRVVATGSDRTAMRRTLESAIAH